MENVRLANMGLSFAVEVAMWTAYGYWGFNKFSGAMGWLVGIGAVVVSIIIWGLWAAPKSDKRLKQPRLVLLKSSLFILAGLALFSAGIPAWAIIFLVFAALNQLLEYYFDPHKNT